MRIAYLGDSVLPSRSANSIQVMKMCGAFAAQGHGVTLVVPDHREIVGPSPWDFYGMDPSFSIARLPWPPFQRGRKHLFGLQAARLARREADLAYGRSLHSTFYAAVRGVQVVYEAHTVPQNAGVVSRMMLRRLVAHQNLLRLVVISAALKDDYVQRFDVPEERVLIAHDGADPPDPTLSPNRVPPDRLQVGYVGHLYSGRGVELIAQLAEHCPSADFHLVGGTEEDLRDCRRKFGALENIRFHGHVPHAETEPFRRSMDVLLAPYQKEVAMSGGGDTSRWMSPLKIFEYMSAGKAILCSDHPVLREVLRHDVTALLLPPDDVDAWVAALKRLGEDLALRKRLGCAALEEFSVHYTWRARAARVLEGLLPRLEKRR